MKISRVIALCLFTLIVLLSLQKQLLKKKKVFAHEEESEQKYRKNQENIIRKHVRFNFSFTIICWIEFFHYFSS